MHPGCPPAGLRAGLARRGAARGAGRPRAAQPRAHVGGPVRAALRLPAATGRQGRRQPLAACAARGCGPRMRRRCGAAAGSRLRSTRSCRPAPWCVPAASGFDALVSELSYRIPIQICVCAHKPSHSRGRCNGANVIHAYVKLLGMGAGAARHLQAGVSSHCFGPHR